MKSETIGRSRKMISVILQLYKYGIVTSCSERQAGVQRRLYFQPRIGIVQKLFELRHTLQPDLRLLRYLVLFFFREFRKLLTRLKKPRAAYLLVEVCRRLERIVVVFLEPRPEVDVELAECLRAVVYIGVSKRPAVTAAGIMREESVCLVDDALDKEIHLLFVSVGKRLE